MSKNSPLKKSHSQKKFRSSQSNLVIEQLTLLYQLEQRKVAKFEEENRALRERINNLLTKEDDQRIELLAADKTRRKLAQLKAITERTIRSLESGLNEFRSFVEDIDEAIEEREACGALEPARAATSPDIPSKPLENYKPALKRIPESPMLLEASSSSHQFNSFSMVEETANGTENIFEQNIGEDMDDIDAVTYEDDNEYGREIDGDKEEADKMADRQSRRIGADRHVFNEDEGDEKMMNGVEEDKHKRKEREENGREQGSQLTVHNDSYAACLVSPVRSRSITVRRTTFRRTTAMDISTPTTLMADDKQQNVLPLKDISQLAAHSHRRVGTPTSSMPTPSTASTNNAGHMKRTIDANAQRFKKMRRAN